MTPEFGGIIKLYMSYEWHRLWGRTLRHPSLWNSFNAYICTLNIRDTLNSVQSDYNPCSIYLITGRLLLWDSSWTIPSDLFMGTHWPIVLRVTFSMETHMILMHFTEYNFFQPPLAMVPCDTTEFTPFISGHILALCKEGYTYQQIVIKSLKLFFLLPTKPWKETKSTTPKVSLSPQPGHPPAVHERTQQAKSSEMPSHIILSPQKMQSMYLAAKSGMSFTCWLPLLSCLEKVIFNEDCSQKGWSGLGVRSAHMDRWIVN